MLREDLVAIHEAAVASLTGDRLVREALAGRPRPQPLRVLALGKAAEAMLAGAEAAWGPLEGIAVGPAGFSAPPGIERLEGAHPVPDGRSVRAGTRLLAWVGSLDPRDALLVLLSGGASALAEAPRAGIDLGDLQATTALLLGAGVPIAEMNAVRRQLSRIKGGGLAAACTAGSIEVLAISDVPGDDPAVLGSGPFFAPRAGTDAREVLARHGLLDRVPPRVRAALASDPAPGARGIAQRTDGADPTDADPAQAVAARRIVGRREGATRTETDAPAQTPAERTIAPRPDGPVRTGATDPARTPASNERGAATAHAAHRGHRRVEHRILAGPLDLARQAAAIARARGFAAEALPSFVEGDVEAVAARWRAWFDAHAGERRLLAAAAEPTVRLPPDPGRGGRSQHLALRLALHLAGGDAAFLAAGSDGRDGTSEHAGAAVDGATAATPDARERIEAALARADSASACAALGVALPARATGTNLADLHLLAGVPPHR